MRYRRSRHPISVPRGPKASSSPSSEATTAFSRADDRPDWAAAYLGKSIRHRRQDWRGGHGFDRSAGKQLKISFAKKMTTKDLIIKLEAAVLRGGPGGDYETKKHHRRSGADHLSGVSPESATPRHRSCRVGSFTCATLMPPRERLFFRFLLVHRGYSRWSVSPVASRTLAPPVSVTPRTTPTISTISI